MGAFGSMGDVERGTSILNIWQLSWICKDAYLASHFTEKCTEPRKGHRTVFLAFFYLVPTR